MIGITGANGNLGHHVIEQLLDHVPAVEIVAAVRNPEKATALHSLGVTVREADYDRPDTLKEAFQGVETVLLISSTIPGQRLRQHMAVIDAAKAAGVTKVVYTSMLRADTSQLILAAEHAQTEAYLKASGLDFVVLRNGWYVENHLSALPMVLAQGQIIGSAKEGRFASATRADYAGAAVAVLTQSEHAGSTYELAGDHAFTMSELADALSKEAATPVTYTDLPPDQYEKILRDLGVPDMIIDVVIDADVKAASGELTCDSGDLARLLGRPTTSLPEALRAALKG